MRGFVSVGAVLPEQTAENVQCHCGRFRFFTTDSIGRTVERCGCGFREVITPVFRPVLLEGEALCRSCGKVFKPKKRSHNATLANNCPDCWARNGKVSKKTRPHHRKGFPIALQLGKNDPLRDDAA